MNKHYLISIKENGAIDKSVNNFYIFHKSKIPYIRDILFLGNKYKILINDRLNK